MKNLLERAKGSALDILVGSIDPVSPITLLLPNNEQIRSLDFLDNRWSDIREFSEFNSGPLPLLRILKIYAVGRIGLDGTDAMIPSSAPLFNNAVNLQEFSLHTQTWPPLNHFVFPNLTFFDLFAPMGIIKASQLLDFLEASPMLQTVRIQGITVDGVPRERAVVLHNVRSFCLVVYIGECGYELAAHISCPSAKHTSLAHEIDAEDIVPQDIFPTSVSWNAIVRQYMRSPVEDVALEITITPDIAIACSLIFRSPDASVIRLRFKVAAINQDEDEDEDEDRVEAFAEMFCEVFSQASRTIRDLANVKRLQIRHNCPFLDNTRTIRIVDEVRRLFGSLDPLEELIFYRCEMEPYLNSFIEHPELHYLRQPVVFPSVRATVLIEIVLQIRRDCLDLCTTTP